MTRIALKFSLRLWFIVSVSLVVSIAPAHCHEPASVNVDYFPLQKGNYWIYSANVEWTLPDTAGEVRQGNLTYKCEVTNTWAKGNIFAARFRGFVDDLSWYDPAAEPGDYVMLRIGANHYHLIHDGAGAFWQRLTESDGESLLEELGEDNLLLEVPLTKGAMFGEFAQTPRGRYCYAVEDARSFDVSSINGGATALMPATEFSIAFRTCPDHSITEFVPGVGITGYVYRHHGTVANCDARLIEFHAAQ